ncbi:MAG: MBL fold metallo-hydrolase [Deltaproteobacteria bacterium]|nr:MBL fold metallo-hydrolase [Deltaproteobacteria bacterium]
MSTPRHHNPGYPITLTLGQETLTAFSISALSTYVLAPELNVAFDMGDCPLDAVPIERVFLSHAHGDHARCLLRHVSLRRLMGMAPAEYFVPEQTLEGFEALAEAWGKLENSRGKPGRMPALKVLKPGEVLWLNRQLAAKSFPVTHTLPSLGYTLFDVRKKLRPEFQGRTGPELADLRRQGVEFEEESWLPRLTYIGDSTIETLYRERHVGQSRVLLLELTFLMEDERELARQRGHTHLDDLLAFLKECPEVLVNEHIVLKHFSMRYTRKMILSVLSERLPKAFLERVHILV